MYVQSDRRRAHASATTGQRVRKECKRSSQRTTSIVTEIIQSLLISDHVSAHDSSFFTKALQKLLTLINEASIKQVHRDAMKRESTEALDGRPPKAQKLSRTETANLSVPFAQDLPSIKSLQFVIRDNNTIQIIVDYTTFKECCPYA